MATETFGFESVPFTEIRGREPNVIPLNKDTKHIFALGRFKLPTFFESLKWKGGIYDINFRKLPGAQSWIKEELLKTRIEEGWPSDRVSFKSKADFVAFKLRWM
ncbi:hypothetical protein LCGC14_1393350 [marine sediment metagenome]|uniref:Uncharacterized protein n=1 Tax=marine sediment metagenome TaxID=412755 RepID=A0A0F9JZ99_9ZZZZ